MASAPKLKAWKKPSGCLQLAFLALSISGYLGLQTTHQEEDPQVISLLAKGWAIGDSSPCQNLEPGFFYEADGESGATEFYVMGNGNLLSSPPHQWPEPPISCRAISKPSFIQEIL